MVIDTQKLDKTLDPESWDDFRVLAHRVADDVVDYLQDIRERPVWQPIPDDVALSARQPLPREGQPADEVYEEFLSNVLPYNMGNVHPRFWGWVMGSGAPMGVLADFLASAMDTQLGGAEHMGSRIEAQVIAWMKEMLGYPPEASGLLTSGGSMANLIGLTVARHARAGWDVRNEGLRAGSQLTVYGSSEMHSSVQRAVEELGIGSAFLRRIPVDAKLRIDTAALREAIERDLADGLKPVCVVANLGATNAGSLDPLDDLADISQEYGLWFHVDGAFGALAYLSPQFRPQLAGMERADSLAFDLHKWVYLPFAVGCVLVRDAEAHRRAFTLRPDYLQHGDRGPSGGDIWFSDYGLELTRSFKALKVWMALKTYGADLMGEMIQQNIDQARYLEDLVQRSPSLELLAPVPLNTVCFRFRAAALSDVHLNGLNQEILFRIQESGSFLPSSTQVAGRFAIRASITNHRTTGADIEALATEVERVGALVLSESAES